MFGSKTSKKPLRAYMFTWTNPRTAVTDAQGTTHSFPHKMVVLAENKEEARMFFAAHERGLQKELRKQMKTRPEKKVSELIERVFAKSGLEVSAGYLIQKGMVL